MSRTDKTRPYLVKVLDKPEYLEECHDHRNGVCDLPPRPRKASELDSLRPPTWREGNCAWAASHAFWTSSDARCACPMCGYDAYWSIPERKRQRIEGKRYCRDGWRDEY